MKFGRNVALSQRISVHFHQTTNLSHPITQQYSENIPWYNFEHNSSKNYEKYHFVYLPVMYLENVKVKWNVMENTFPQFTCAESIRLVNVRYLTCHILICSYISAPTWSAHTNGGTRNTNKWCKVTNSSITVTHETQTDTPK